VVTLTDITPLKQAEEEMRRQRLEIEQLYREAPVGLCLLDKDLRFIRINHRLAEINGFPAAEHIGKTVREMLPELADAVEHPMRRILETGEPQFNIELISSTPAQPGVKRSFLEQWLPVIDGRGRVTGLNIVVEEITERKRMEQMLRESEEKFRSAFANAAIGFAMATPEGRFADANPAFCRITGYSIEELRAMEWPQLIHPDDYAKSIGRIDQMLSENSNSVVIENRYVRKDRSVTWVRKSISMVRDANGALRWGIALIEDISKRKQTEEALRESEARFRQVAESLPQLVWTCAVDGSCDYLSP
jgi:PAS domain S-box-containing protein